MSGRRSRLARYVVTAFVLTLSACASPAPPPPLATSTPVPLSPPGTTTPSPSKTAVPSPSTSHGPTASPVAAPTLTPAASTSPTSSPTSWTRIANQGIQWAPDSAHFSVVTATGTEIRDRQFGVVQLFDQLRRPAWIDDAHLVGYLSPTDDLGTGKVSTATPVIVSLGSTDVQQTSMPLGRYPQANWHGSAAIGAVHDPRSYNDHFVVWSTDGSVTKRQTGYIQQWSNDGTRLIVVYESSPFSRRAEVLGWPGLGEVYKPADVNEDVGELDPSGTYVFAWWSIGSNSGYTRDFELRIVNLETGDAAAVPFLDEESEPFTFWTSDSHVSADDGVLVKVLDTTGNLVDSYAPPLATVDSDVPYPSASDDGSSVAFFSENRPIDIAVIRNGRATYYDPPVAGDRGNDAYLSPDGSILEVISGNDENGGMAYLTDV